MLTAKFNLRDVEAGMRAMSMRAENIRPLFKRFEKLLRNELKQHFVERRGIRGERWPRYATATRDKIYGTRARPERVVESRSKKTGKLVRTRVREWGPYRNPSELQQGAKRRRRLFLKKSGRISNAGKRRLGNQLGRLRTAIKMEVLDRSIRATSIPDFAGVHEFGGYGYRGARIPQRSFMYASEQLVSEFNDLLVRHVLKGWGKGVQ